MYCAPPTYKEKYSNTGEPTRARVEERGQNFQTHVKTSPLSPLMKERKKENGRESVRTMKTIHCSDRERERKVSSCEACLLSLSPYSDTFFTRLEKAFTLRFSRVNHILQSVKVSHCCRREEGSFSTTQYDICKMYKDFTNHTFSKLSNDQTQLIGCAFAQILLPSLSHQ
jgi:hypothetical protein